MKNLGLALINLPRLEDIICQKTSGLPWWPGQGGREVGGGRGPLHRPLLSKAPPSVQGCPQRGPHHRNPQRPALGGLLACGAGDRSGAGAPTGPGHLPSPDSFVPQTESGCTWARAPLLSHGPASCPSAPLSPPPGHGCPPSASPSGGSGSDH